MAEIISICYQPEPSTHTHPFRFNRVEVDTASLISNHGIEGDRKAGRNPNRQLNILDYAVVQELAREGYQVDPGELGEQIVVSGIDLMSLNVGERVRLGANAIVEIRKPRTACAWFEQIQGKVADAARNRVGMMARVVEGGEICVGDPVAVLKPEHA